MKMTDTIFGLLLLLGAIWMSVHEPDIWKYFEEKARIEHTERQAFMRSCLERNKYYECVIKYEEMKK